MIQLIIKATEIELTPQLREYVEHEVLVLEKFLSYKGEVPVWVEIGCTTQHHKKGNIFRAELQMRLPNSSLRAEAERKDLRSALNEAIGELQRSIVGWKEEQITQHRRKSAEE